MSNKSLMVFSKNNIWTTLFTALVSCLTAISTISIFNILVIKQISDPITYINKNQITVYAFPERSKVMTEDKATVIENYLKESTAIESYQRLSNDKIKYLINKFLKFDKIINTIQLPIVFQVSLTENSGITYQDLEFALNNKVENVFVESKNDSIKLLSSKVLGIKNTLTVIPFLLLFALLTSVGIFVIALLHLYKKELNILMFLGTNTIRIAKEYSLWIANITLKGSLIGVLLGAVVSAIIGFIFQLTVAFYFLTSFLIILVFLPFVLTTLTYLLASIIVLNLSYKEFQK